MSNEKSFSVCQKNVATISCCSKLINSAVRSRKEETINAMQEYDSSPYRSKIFTCADCRRLLLNDYVQKTVKEEHYSSHKLDCYHESACC